MRKKRSIPKSKKSLSCARTYYSIMKTSLVDITRVLIGYGAAQSQKCFCSAIRKWRHPSILKMAAITVKSIERFRFFQTFPWLNNCLKSSIMPSSEKKTLKDLHVASNLGELNKLADSGLPTDSRSVNPTTYVTKYNSVLLLLTVIVALFTRSDFNSIHGVLRWIIVDRV